MQVELKKGNQVKAKPYSRMLRGSVNSSMHRIAVDAFSTLSFFTIAGMATEVFILRMSIEQSIKAREFAAVVNVLTGRPYGNFRGYVFKKMKTTEQSSFVRKMASDTVAFAVFQGPLYAAILHHAGADRAQILSGVGLVALSAGFIGRPLGWYQDALRKAAGLNPACYTHEPEPKE